MLFFVPYLTTVYQLGFNATYYPNSGWVGIIVIASNIAFYEWPEKHVSLGASMIALSSVFLLYSLYLWFGYLTLPIFRIFGLFAISGSIISLIGGYKTLRWKSNATA